MGILLTNQHINAAALISSINAKWLFSYFEASYTQVQMYVTVCTNLFEGD